MAAARKLYGLYPVKKRDKIYGLYPVNFRALNYECRRISRKLSFSCNYMVGHSLRTCVSRARDLWTTRNQFAPEDHLNSIPEQYPLNSLPTWIEQIMWNYVDQQINIWHSPTRINVFQTFRIEFETKYHLKDGNTKHKTVSISDFRCRQWNN